MKQKCDGKCREKNNLAISQKLGASNFKLKDQREIKHTHKMQASKTKLNA